MDVSKIAIRGSNSQQNVRKTKKNNFRYYINIIWHIMISK